MKTKFTLLLLFFVLFNTANSLSSPVIILKLDDLMALNGQCTSKETMDYLISKQVKYSYGVIANRIDETSYKTLSPYINAVDSNGDKLLEIWHHGFDHVIPEFREKTYEYQKSHFEQADQRVKQLLNIQMHTFGAPGNATDSVTPFVISENPNYKVFMLGYAYKKDYYTVVHLMQRVEAENGTGNVNYDYFVDNYNKYKNIYKDYMIVQLHPNNWDADHLNELKKIIDFLISENCKFELPYDYFCEEKSIKKPSNLEGVFDKDNNQVLLKWTGDYSSMVDYDVQCSDDSISWKSIGRTSPNGYLTDVKNNAFKYIDINPISTTGIKCYRVKLNNGLNNGYTNFVSFKIGIDRNYLKNKYNELVTKIYPNPCVSTLSIEYKVTEEGIIKCEIYRFNGEKVLSLFNEVQTTGYKTKTVNIESLNAGIYYIKLRSSNGLYSTSKVLVKR